MPSGELIRTHEAGFTCKYGSRLLSEMSPKYIIISKYANNNAIYAEWTARVSEIHAIEIYEMSALPLQSHHQFGFLKLS